MDKQGNQLHRQLAPLKMVSRLLGHEMHAQGTASTISLSREELSEIRTTIDLFIEEATRRNGSLGSGSAGGGPIGSGLLASEVGGGAMGATDLPMAVDISLVPARN
ncbi:MAG: hypothetical protein V3T22_03990 [Planctomycetota bacterium]